MNTEPTQVEQGLSVLVVADDEFLNKSEAPQIMNAVLNDLLETDDIHTLMWIRSELDNHLLLTDIVANEDVAVLKMEFIEDASDLADIVLEFSGRDDYVLSDDAGWFLIHEDFYDPRTIT